VFVVLDAHPLLSAFQIMLFDTLCVCSAGCPPAVVSLSNHASGTHRHVPAHHGQQDDSHSGGLTSSAPLFYSVLDLVSN